MEDGGSFLLVKSKTCAFSLVWSLNDRSML